ncbi:helix-turn-helix domain-containing protein [Leptospira congkakensis]|uniref:Helix-turn-helix domain-containing protein n=1 Tax=Leptospira congkakensis TaxID=2484932 RepID=A0A4Z1AND9_9LEPT|nr:helix-turn-helix domain-containing protein [Leptospira congkakensis]TGL85267.1 helix-turn-helix domain-containing protein [Leptospira congkakensis]TGL85382.1 helix-turn-helix domain-containing protein [Leptospira congkakensis]TGL99873.1 helix-turn-helix domain-containing protein [Leptospira congkakensis]
MNELKRTGVWVAQWMDDLGLSPNQTKLYAEIVSLDAKGGCFASNEYLGMVLRLKRDTVSRLVSQLKKKGLLKQTGFDGRKRFLKPLVPELSSEVGLDVDPKRSLSTVVKNQNYLGLSSKSGSSRNTKPSYKYQVHTNIQKDRIFDGKDDWMEFLEWSEKQLSLSTRALLTKLKGPEFLSGLQLSYWERFKSHPR